MWGWIRRKARLRIRALAGLLDYELPMRTDLPWTTQQEICTTDLHLPVGLFDGSRLISCGASAMSCCGSLVDPAKQPRNRVRYFERARSVHRKVGGRGRGKLCNHVWVYCFIMKLHHYMIMSSYDHIIVSSYHHIIILPHHHISIPSHHIINHTITDNRFKNGLDLLDRSTWLKHCK